MISREKNESIAHWVLNSIELNSIAHLPKKVYNVSSIGVFRVSNVGNCNCHIWGRIMYANCCKGVLERILLLTIWWRKFLASWMISAVIISLWKGCPDTGMIVLSHQYTALCREDLNQCLQRNIAGWPEATSYDCFGNCQAILLTKSTTNAIQDALPQFQESGYFTFSLL